MEISQNSEKIVNFVWKKVKNGERGEKKDDLLFLDDRRGGVFCSVRLAPPWCQSYRSRKKTFFRRPTGGGVG